MSHHSNFYSTERPAFTLFPWTSVLYFVFLLNPIQNQARAETKADGSNLSSVAESVSVSNGVRSFLQTHCVDCHQGEGAEAGFDLIGSDGKVATSLALAQWIRLHDRVENHEMPPPEAMEIQSAERSAFIKSLGEALRGHEARQRSKIGRVQSRRLTNLQLERTLHDLLAIDRPLAKLMPEEQRIDGFNGVSQAQTMSHFLLESHLTVVDAALDAAMERLVDPIEPFHRIYAARDLARANPKQRCRDPEMIGDRAVVWSGTVSFYGRITSTTVKESGWYRIRFTASAEKSPETGGVWCSVRSGQCNSGAPLMDWIGSFEAMPEPSEHVYEAWLPAGHMIEIRPADATLKRASFRGGQVGAGEGGPQNVPGVALHSMDLETIYPGGKAERVQQRLFGDLKLAIQRGREDVKYVGSEPFEDSKKQLLTFASRAFRRQLQEQDLQQYINWLESELRSGKDPVRALLSTYRAILCSSRFLYLMEPIGRLDAEAIASRLSYFLWGSMPDDELLLSCRKPDFLQPESLLAQVDRLLKHPRGSDFVKDFASQWLDLLDINFTEPDRKLYRDFDFVVQNAMLEETHRFLQWLLDQNAPINKLLNAKQTFLNSRLARYYGIDGVEGDQMKLVRVDKQSHRGGLLTHGSILKVTANGTNTSPVLRGVWVSERLLGVSVPPPPENVPAVEPDIRGAKTIREQLQLHLSHAECKGCHAKMDPPGYALENFDAAGRWRKYYPVVSRGKSKNGALIDSSGVFADGEAFSDFEDFRRGVVGKPLPIAKNFAEKLITYGTGSEISFSDREELDRLLDRAAEDEFGMRSILNQLILSSIFLTK